MLLAVGALPLIVAAARLVPLVSSGWTPIRDDALLELRTADVGSQSVLLGPYSRFGWHHPGPSLFYVLALPYRLLGRSSVALPLTAVAINLVAVVGIAVLAYRRGGRTLLVAVLLVVEVYLATLGPWVLRSAWNPYVGILPFALLLMLGWCIGCGDGWCLPLAVGVGSFVVQTHIGFAAAVVAVLVASALWRWARHDTPVRLAHVGLAVAVLVLLWVPPAAEQLAHDPGNLGLIESSLGPAEPSLTPLEGARVALVRVGSVPAWLAGTGGSPGPEGGGAALWPGVLTFGVLVAVAVAAWRHGRRDRLQLTIITTVALVACAWTAGRIEGAVEGWLVMWMSVPGLFVWGLAGWMVLDALARAPKLRGAAMLVAGAAVTAMAVGNAGAALNVTLWRPDAAETVAALERQLEPRLRAEERLAVMGFGPRASHVSPMGWGAGLVLALDKDDVDVRVDRRWRLQFGENRTDTRGTGMRLTVTTDERYIPARDQALLAEADGVFVYGSA